MSYHVTTDQALNEKLTSERKKELRRLAGNFKSQISESQKNAKLKLKAKEVLIRKRDLDFYREISLAEEILI